jgi:type II secretory pathway component PulF
MATFRFKAVDSQGKEILSTVEAEDQAAAIAKIRAMKLTPKAIGMVKDDAKTAAATAAMPTERCFTIAIFRQ